MPSPTVAGLVAIGVLRRISWGGTDDVALRTQHSFTLGERLSALTNYDCRQMEDKDARRPKS